MFWQKKPSKITIDEAKDLFGIVKEKRSTGSGDFIDQLRKFKDFEREAAADHENTVNDILEKYGYQDQEGSEKEPSAMEAMALSILQGFMNKRNTPPIISDVQQTLPASVSASHTSEAVNPLIPAIAAEIKKNKKIKPFVDQLKNYSDQEIMQLINEVRK